MRPSVSYMRFCAHICSHFHSSRSRAEINQHKQRYKRVMSKLPVLERDMVILQDNRNMLDRIVKAKAKRKGRAREESDAEATEAAPPSKKGASYFDRMQYSSLTNEQAASANATSRRTKRGFRPETVSHESHES